jgi:hypothetical protein
MSLTSTPGTDDESSAVGEQTSDPTARRHGAPVILVVVLLGLGAFAWAGFVARPESNAPILREPWPLFLWLCLLILATQWAILRGYCSAGLALQV